MKQFAVAFTTTGHSPKEGHRFSEIVLVGQDDGVPNGQCAKFKLDVEPESKPLNFRMTLDAMKTLVGDATVVVHDAGNWRRFLRAELKNIKRHGANNLVNNVIEVRSWAHQRFPRQRKDLVAIARRSGIEIPAGMSGIDLDAELLRCIANQMIVQNKALPAMTEAQLIQPKGKQNLIEKIGTFWRRLTGRA